MNYFILLNLWFEGDGRGSGPSRDVEKGEAIRLSSVVAGGTPLHDDQLQAPNKASGFVASAGKVTASSIAFFLHYDNSSYSTFVYQISSSYPTCLPLVLIMWKYSLVVEVKQWASCGRKHKCFIPK